MTPFNAGHRLYFNLAGHNAGRDAIREHIICINADSYLNANKSKSVDVGDTPFDFRVNDLMSRFMDLNGTGFDTEFLINLDDNNEKSFAARLYHPESGRAMEIYSDQPVIIFNDCAHFPEFMSKPVKEVDEVVTKMSDTRFLSDLRAPSSSLVDVADDDEIKYAQNMYWPQCSLRKQSKVNTLNPCQIMKYLSLESSYQSICTDVSGLEDNGIKGKENAVYYKNDGVYFQVQNYSPNSKSYRKFRDEVILQPGKSFEQKVIYKFGLFLKPVECRE